MVRTRARVVLSFLCGACVMAMILGSTEHMGTLAAATRYESLSLFASALQIIRKHYVEPVDERSLVEGAVHGMLQQLDPHSAYLDPLAYKEVQIDTSGEFHGLGIEVLKRRDGFLEVVAPIEGTPAARAGIRTRDRIVAICPVEPLAEWEGESCRSTESMTLFEAVELLRGPKGSRITIQVDRKGFERPHPYTIVRARVKVVSVDGRLLEPGYAYVRVRSFQERTADDLRRRIAKLREESGGAFEGLILDLRDNPGGLLDQAVQVVDLWLREGLIVYTQGRVEARHEFTAHQGGTEAGYPMVILVNAGSASASEIVAGALQDQHRALVLGTQTFGKGSVQSVYPLEEGAALRLTTSLYYTPEGRSIQRTGVSPDIQVEATPAGEVSGVLLPEDVPLARGLEVLKSWSTFERLSDANPTVQAARTKL